MSCPFKHLWPKGAGEGEPAATAAPNAVAALGAAHAAPLSGGDAQEGAPGPAAATARPPAGHTPAARPAATGRPPAGLDPATPGAAGAAGSGQCPFLSGLGGMGLAPAASGDAGEGQAGGASGVAGPEASSTAGAPAVCPLGFGSSKQPELGEFHCLLCKSLYHDCVEAACGHRFCAGCIRGARDCVVCGGDLGDPAHDTHTQAMVDRYIEAHAHTHTLWELEGSGAEGAVEGMAGERSRPSFLLQLGLRALAAGNIDSARARLQMCQADLRQQLEAAPPPAQAPLQCRLGAVSGCLGDCCRAEGDAEVTLRHYETSVRLLQAAGSDPEAQQALSVALSKVGELRHLQGDVAAAADQYSAALQLRRALMDATREQVAAGGCGGGGGEACRSAALDLATSCLKLAGARRGLGAEAEAEALLAEAEGLLGALEGGLGGQPQRLQRKAAALAQFAAAMREQ